VQTRCRSKALRDPVRLEERCCGPLVGLAERDDLNSILLNVFRKPPNGIVEGGLVNLSGPHLLRKRRIELDYSSGRAYVNGLISPIT
jgi:hypothetical protein